MKKLALHGGKKIISKNLLKFNTIGSRELKLATKVLKSGLLSGFIATNSKEFNGGENILKLEQLWSEKFNVKNSISFNSNTSGLIAAVGAINTNPGDEIIVPPYTMSATVMAPLQYGAIPVFADIDPDYFCISVESILKKITKKTRAIIAVNLFGHAAELHKLKRICKKKIFIL